MSKKVHCSLCEVPYSSVGISIHYGLDGPGIESRWGQDFRHPSRPALGSTQPPVQRVPGLSRGQSGRGVVLTTPTSSAEVEGRVELYICFPSGPSWPVLGWILPLEFILYSCPILMKFEFSADLEKYSNIKLNENQPSGSRAVSCGQTDMTKLTGAFSQLCEKRLNTWLITTNKRAKLQRIVTSIKPKQKKKTTIS